MRRISTSEWVFIGLAVLEVLVRFPSPDVSGNPFGQVLDVGVLAWLTAGVTVALLPAAVLRADADAWHTARPVLVGAITVVVADLAPRLAARTAWSIDASASTGFATLIDGNRLISIAEVMAVLAGYLFMAIGLERAGPAVARAGGRRIAVAVTVVAIATGVVQLWGTWRITGETSGIDDPNPFPSGIWLWPLLPVCIGFLLLAIARATSGRSGPVRPFSLVGIGLILGTMVVTSALALLPIDWPPDLGLAIYTALEVASAVGSSLLVVAFGLGLASRGRLGAPAGPLLSEDPR